MAWSVRLRLFVFGPKGQDVRRLDHRVLCHVAADSAAGVAAGEASQHAGSEHCWLC